MAEREKTGQSKQGDTKRKQRTPQNRPQPCPDFSQEFDPALLIGETPFEPSLEDFIEPIAQRTAAHSSEDLHRMIVGYNHVYGNAYVQRLMNSKAIQAQLKISPAHDPYELEADGIAESVTRTSISDVQREAPEEPQTEVMHRAVQEEDTRTRASEELESRIQAARGNGQALSSSIRSDLEPRFGQDFSQVKVHTDNEANKLNKAVNAEAFTTGRDIFFREGNYQPETRDGQKLIAHELTHVVQQNGSQKLNRVVTPERQPAQVPGEVFRPKPTEGMDRPIYEAALEKFKKMSRWRIFGGEHESERRFAALKYLKDMVNLDPLESQIVINSVLKAYQEVFGEELEETRAPEDIKGRKTRKLTTWEKIKEFVVDVFKPARWSKAIKDFIDICKDPVKSIPKIETVLPEFLSFAQPVADKVASWAQYIPVAGIVVKFLSVAIGIKSTYQKWQDTKALGEAAKAASKDKTGPNADLAQAAEYGYAKVNRGFWSRFIDLAKNTGTLVVSLLGLVVGAMTAGTGLIVSEAINLASLLVDMVNFTWRKVKGFFKWAFGTRGKGRRDNAFNIVKSARDGSSEAIDLILKLDVSGTVRGGKFDRLSYWLKHWGNEKKKSDVEELKKILQQFDDNEIGTLVNALADKLKSQ
jgi:hypothetical protein